MRNLILTTAAVAAAIGLAGCGDNSGTLTDERDGQTYKTVKIGKQTWMAQNLNYQTESGSWCSKKATSNCDDCKIRIEEDTSNCNKYGRLYDWTTAIMACPDGYHLPSRQEWSDLVIAVGGKPYIFMAKNVTMYMYENAAKKLIARNAWNDDKDERGMDKYGFSALPGGYWYSNDVFCLAGNNCCSWWTATEHDSNDAYMLDINLESNIVEDDYTDKRYAFSVRCIANRR